MIYVFKQKLSKHRNHFYIKVPFNVWEEFHQKGLRIKVTVEQTSYECKLISQGNGAYYIPVNKDIVNQVDVHNGLNVSFEIIDRLKRINHDSPQTKEHPIQKIDHIEIDHIKKVPYPKLGYNGHICIAMLTGKSIEEVIDITNLKMWQCTFSKLIETLDYFGISYSDQMVYPQGEKVDLPECCIVQIKNKIHHLVLYYKGKFYDKSEVTFDQIARYLEIYVE